MGSNQTPHSVSFAISETEITARFGYILYRRSIEREKLGSMSITVRMAKWSKTQCCENFSTEIEYSAALMWAWVQIPLLTVSVLRFLKSALL